MTVAVAHQGTNDSDHVLLEAVREASARGESLAVIHVRRAVDEDLEAAVAAGVKDAVERVTAKAGSHAVPYELHVAAGTADDLAGALLDEADAVKASILVIGARHRSPVGKAFLGLGVAAPHPRGRRPGARRQAAALTRPPLDAETPPRLRRAGPRASRARGTSPGLDGAGSGWPGHRAPVPHRADRARYSEGPGSQARRSRALRSCGGSPVSDGRSRATAR